MYVRKTYCCCLSKSDKSHSSLLPLQLNLAFHSSPHTCTNEHYLLQKYKHIYNCRAQYAISTACKWLVTGWNCCPSTLATSHRESTGCYLVVAGSRESSNLQILNAPSGNTTPHLESTFRCCLVDRSIIHSSVSLTVHISGKCQYPTGESQ